MNQLANESDSAVPAHQRPAETAKVSKTRRPLWLRIVRALLWIVAIVLIVLVALGAAAWWWGGTAGSLATVLSRAAQFMPAGMSLTSRDVTGDLRRGGHIGHLRWEGPSLAVEVNALDIGWQLAPLLDRKLQLGELHAEQVLIEPRGTPTKEKEPTQPLTQLALPIDIDLPFRIDLIRWAGPPVVDVNGLAGRYQYVDQHHQLKIDGVDVMDGHYSAQLKLQGPAPMALEAALDAKVRAPVPEGANPLTVLGNAKVDGNLSGPQARLKIQAEVRPEAVAESGANPPSQPEADPLHLALNAELAPWAPQPVISALADLSNLDAARLYPGAPTTLLNGQVTAGPAENTAPGAPTTWQASVDLKNDKPGPWDKKQLPLERIEANAQYDGTQLVLPGATIDIGGGRISAKGNWSPSPAAWQMSATISDLKPAQLYSELDPTPIDGSVKVNEEGGAIVFDAQLQAQIDQRKARNTRTTDGPLGGFRLDRALAQGQWKGQTLELRTLQIEAEKARIEGRLTARIDEKSGEGKLDVNLPGASALLSGNVAPATGTADVNVRLDDAAVLQRWVESLPGLSKAFGGAAVRGGAKLDASWRGGWETAMRQIQGQPVQQGEKLELKVDLDAARLDVKLPAGAAPEAKTSDTLQLRDLKLAVAGTPADATLAFDGKATLGSRKLDLRTRASGGMQDANRFRVALASLKLQAQDSQLPGTKAGAGTWTVELDKAVSATLRRTPAPSPAGAAGLDLESTAGSLSVSGPVPGKLGIDWEPIRFSKSATASAKANASFSLRSKGQLRGLQMAWADAFTAAGGNPLENAGIRGDLVLDGAWDIDTGDVLKAEVKLARRSGDIRVSTGDSARVTRIKTTGTGTASERTLGSGKAGSRKVVGASTAAGLRQLELVIDAQGDAVRARFDWASERAGKISADANTRLAKKDGAWTLPDDAPVGGKISASLPDIGVWSVLAPPGWRIDGTLKADIALAGTKADPRWNGTISADGLTIKAAVEGIDLRDGRLRARLSGNRLELTEFVLKGGPGSDARISGRSGNLSTAESEAEKNGGNVSATGSISWGNAGQTDGGIRMAITAKLDSLRVLARSDRQISISGELPLKLEQGQITVGGALKIDRAVIILPDATAPTLGTDVVVTSAAIEAEKARKEKEERAKADRADKAAKADAEAVEAAKPKTAKPPDVSVSLDLGNDFAVQGKGFKSRLEGKLQITSNASTRGAPRVTGEVRTVMGQYKAYGQDLSVEKGIVRFNGPVDNPALDILAVRPNIQQRAGVQITGSAQSPRVALFSDPNLPDAETLSWILFGRASASGGAEALVVQQAALAVLGGLGPKGSESGSLAGRLGLDEVGFKGGGEGAGVSGAALTLGKRISKDFYVTYERSLSGALGSLYIFYDLTRRLTLRAEAGKTSGLDLIYTISYD